MILFSVMKQCLFNVNYWLYKYVRHLMVMDAFTDVTFVSLANFYQWIAPINGCSKFYRSEVTSSTGRQEWQHILCT